MKRCLTALVIALFFGQICGPAKAAEPELKFNPNEVTEESRPTGEGKYGEKPLLRIGNDHQYFKAGGYGSMRFSADSAEDLHDTFTFRRFVLTTDAKIASRFRIYSELEFERFRKVEFQGKLVPNNQGGLSFRHEVEGVNDSEISLEQAWFELEFKNYIRLRGGAVLVPVGRFNINHDDNAWNLPRRPLADRGVPVLPVEAAWDELGFGLNGDIEIGEKGKINYQIYVVNGATLDANLEQNISTRAGDTTEQELEAEVSVNTGTFSNDVKDSKAVTGRLMYSPALGHEFGFSGYWGRYTPDFLANKSLLVLGFDTLQTFGNFDFEAEYLFNHLDGLRDVMESLGTHVINNTAEAEISGNPGIETELAFTPSGLASTKQGYWVELRYHFRPKWLTDSFFGRHFSDPQLIPVVRWEQAFLRGLATDVQVQNGALTTFQTQNRYVDRITAGLAFRLNPLAVFHLAYEYTQTNQGQALADVTNFLPTLSDHNHSFMFGAAFGF